MGGIAVANAPQAVALGRDANATAGQSIAIGLSTRATGTNAIAIGTLITAGPNQTAIGNIFTTIATTRGVFVDSNNVLGTIASSRRYKENFRSLDKHSAKLYKLNPVEFDYRAEQGGLRNQFGLIAEEVAEHLPEIVVSDEKGQIETVQYHILPSLLLNEAQKHQKNIQKLNDELASLKTALALLIAEFASFKEASRQ